MRRLSRGFALALLSLGWAVHAHAQTPPDTTTPLDPTSSVPTSSVPTSGEVDGESVSGGNEGGAPLVLPLIPVPLGCDTPTKPHIVFLGTVEDRDYRSVRFHVDTVRSGRGEPFVTGGLIDIRYGLEAQYLLDGEQYLVSAAVDPDLGLLVSRLTDPVEDFGGDEVIGVSETDVDCPDLEDPIRTLHVDGTPVETSLLGPFFASKIRLLGAFLIPLGVAVAVIFLLAMFRLSIAGLYRSVVDDGRRNAH